MFNSIYIYILHSDGRGAWTSECPLWLHDRGPYSLTSPPLTLSLKKYPVLNNKQILVINDRVRSTINRFNLQRIDMNYILSCICAITLKLYYLVPKLLINVSTRIADQYNLSRTKYLERYQSNNDFFTRRSQNVMSLFRRQKFARRKLTLHRLTIVVQLIVSAANFIEIMCIIIFYLTDYCTFYYFLLLNSF